MKPYLEAKNTKELCKMLGLSADVAGRIEIRRDLIIGIRDVIRKNEWTHEKAAEKAQVGRTVVTGIVNGNVEKISTDRLIDVANRLGLKLHLEVA